MNAATRQMIEDRVAKRAEELAMKRSRKKPSRQVDEGRIPGLIRDDELYTPSEILARIGLGRAWIRNAVKSGLETVPAGRSYLISGKLLKDYLLKSKSPKKSKA